MKNNQLKSKYWYLIDFIFCLSIAIVVIHFFKNLLSLGVATIFTVMAAKRLMIFLFKLFDKDE